MIARKIFLSIVTLLFAVTAAFAAGADAWQTLPPVDPNWETAAQAVPPADMIVVPDATRALALKKLATDSIVPLDPLLTLKLLPGVTLPADAALKPYLVRGVALDEKAGGFSVETNAGTLWVMFNCLSATPPPPAHRALVVYLASPPTQLFVTATALQ
jgi:hypothetical protein